MLWASAHLLIVVHTLHIAHGLNFMPQTGNEKKS